MGTNIGRSAKFKTPPILPHGLNGIIVSPYATIGANCVIRQQVTIAQKGDGKAPTIGDNVIIGANAVITKSFPKNCVIAGVPAKIIKENQNEKN